MVRNRIAQLKLIKLIIAIISMVYGYSIVGASFDEFLNGCIKKFTTTIDVDKIIDEGDVETYHALIDSVKNDKRAPYRNSSYIDYSLIMAHYYDYVPANYDVYEALVSVFGIEKTDSNTMNMALYYLNRGKRKGDKRCEKELLHLSKEKK